MSASRQRCFLITLVAFLTVFALILVPFKEMTNDSQVGSISQHGHVQTRSQSMDQNSVLDSKLRNNKGNNFSYKTAQVDKGSQDMTQNSVENLNLKNSVMSEKSAALYSGNLEIKLKDIEGNIVINKNVTKHWNEPLKKLNPREEILAFIHIGKSGGMSFEAMLRNSVLKENNCNMKCSTSIEQLKSPQPNCQQIKPMLCFDHFDWSAITEAENQGHKMAPVVLFRNPVSRVISHFYYARSIEWTKGLKIRKQSLEQYLNDPESMMETHSIWHDGQGGGQWLAGTAYEKWIWNIKNKPEDELLRRERLTANWTYMLDTTLENLHQCLWIGLIERLDDSLEMFEYQTGLKMEMKHINRNKKYAPPSDEVIKKLKELMPMDLYIYEYVKQLFERRWQMYLREKSENAVKQTLPTLNVTLPSVINGCKTTRQFLQCPGQNTFYKKKQ